jgi:uncharacterized protein YbbC (DUF1343 family)
VRFRPVSFEPTFQKHARTACGGCQVHVTDRLAFRPVETAVTLIHAFRAADPRQFTWRPPPYEYEPAKQPIDILFGSDELRSRIEAGESPDTIARAWQPELDRFLPLRERHLMY